jgi:hypothetical protein
MRWKKERLEDRGARKQESKEAERLEDGMRV